MYVFLQTPLLSAATLCSATLGQRFADCSGYICCFHTPPHRHSRNLEAAASWHSETSRVLLLSFPPLSLSLYLSAFLSSLAACLSIPAIILALPPPPWRRNLPAVTRTESNTVYLKVIANRWLEVVPTTLHLSKAVKFNTEPASLQLILYIDLGINYIIADSM